MNRFFLIFSSILALSLAIPQEACFAIATPEVMAHAGHGDEFQATGGINRVEVKTETDSLLGIRVAPIATAAAGSGAVLIPVTAAVEDDGRQVVFVQYEGFYEPVEITIGETQGDWVEVTEGLSLGEQLVTEGSLSLYAESRKTQAAEAVSPDSSIPAAETLSKEEHIKADAEGIPHSHGDETHPDESERQGGISKQWLAAIGGGIGLLAGVVFLAKGNRSKGETSN